MRIIGTWSSPFTRKVRIVAMEHGIPAEFVVDSPLSSPTQVPSFNPLGKVPILVRDDNSVLIDSSLIAAWLDGVGEGQSLLPTGELERTIVLQWEAVADGVLDAAVLIRMETLRVESERSQAWIERQQTKVEGTLAWMNRRLGGRDWCEGDRFSLADIAVGCCLAYLEFRLPEGRWRERYANVAHISADLERRESFKATMLRA